MIEGQEGVTWPQWIAISQACEKHGIRTLNRSDHYMSVLGSHPERGSLDAIGTLIALAAVTTDLRLGTMISPVTFRHPSELAKLVTVADHVSGGRVELGIGAGWYEREHEAYGFEYHDLADRMERLAEQLEIIHGIWGEGSFSFSGKHYRLVELDAQPKPVQRPHPRLIIGGAAQPRGAALAARFADEYNTANATVAEVADRKARIDAACERAGREPIPLSLMTPVVVAESEADLRTRIVRATEFREMGSEDLPDYWVVGTVEQVAEKLQALGAAGVSRVLCQHMPHDDLELIEILGRGVAPLLG